MVIFFTEEDLVSFGEYLLSDERKQKLEENWPDTSEILESNLKKVHDADLANWAYSAQKKFTTSE